MDSLKCRLHARSQNCQKQSAMETVLEEQHYGIVKQVHFYLHLLRFVVVC